MKTWSLIQDRLQGLGRALMLPIAVLPVAGLMLRIGQPDLLGLPFIASAGQAIFAHLGLLFAIGVGVGLAKENNGAAGLAGAVAYVVLTEGAKVLMHMPEGALPKGSFDQATHDALVGLWKDKELAKLSVPAGILSGLAAGALYNRFYDIRFPEYLSFFGGRRFVPIVSGLFGLVAAVAFGLGFPALETAVDQLSYWVANAGSVGLFLYGLLNRLLIVTGLHHILNNIVWFVLGDYKGTTGDLNRFFAGDPDAGIFMTGFFPVMMFGLPAACLAMWRAARPERRQAVGGMLFSMAFTSFLTGVTEPIEFTFMFLAPALYLFHAIMTGISMALMDILGTRIGFGFSAGLFDYLLNLPLSTRAWLLLPVGLTYSAIYYAAFSFAIRRFNLATPGREAEDTVTDTAEVQTANTLPAAYLAALGGPKNLLEIGACTTRLRLTIADRKLVSVPQLKAIGAKAVLEIGERSLQVVIGPDSDRIANAMRTISNNLVNTVPLTFTATEQFAPAAAVNPALFKVFGGAENVTQAFRKDSRTIIEVRDPKRVDLKHANAPKPDHVHQTAQGWYHVIDAA